MASVPHPRTEVLHVFLNDALRLNQEALECLRQLTEQVRIKRVSPAQIRSFTQLIHTLKGTASLVEEAQGVASRLHALESCFHQQDILVLAKTSENWLPQSHSALEWCLDFLSRFQRRERYGLARDAQAPGFLVSRDGGLFWLPIGALLKVFSPGELVEKETVTLDGVSIPIHASERRESLAVCFGLVVVNSGQSVCVMVDEIIELSSWADACMRDAQAGLEVLDAWTGSKTTQSAA